MNNLLRPPEIIAKFLKINKVDTVFGLCGGHIMPIWMELDKAGIKIVDTRDERAAVFMAHSYSEFSGKISYFKGPIISDFWDTANFSGK